MFIRFLVKTIFEEFGRREHEMFFFYFMISFFETEKAIFIIKVSVPNFFGSLRFTKKYWS